MSADRVILWRHGQTDLNLSNRIQGSQDFPLNQTGIDQAREAAIELAKLQPVLIVSSPLSRAHDTALALGDLTGVTVETDQGLIERNYGEWEGLNREQILAVNPAQYDVWRSGGHPQGIGVEHNSEVGKRVAAAVVRASERVEGGSVVVVAHGAALRAGITSLLGLDPEGWSGLRGMDNCHWAVLIASGGRNPQWRLVSYNEGQGGAPHAW